MRTTELTSLNVELTRPFGVSAITFSSWRAAAVWTLVGASGLGVYLSSRASVRGALCGLVALFAVQAAISFALGVRLKAGRMAMPRTLWAGAPLLVLGRRSFVLPALKEVTSSGRVMIFELVRLLVEERQNAALFDTREHRRAFLDEVSRRQPLVKIYRAISPRG
jgi:hypothetical protein